MTDQRRAYLCAGAAVLAWSTVASAFKLSLRHLSPLELVWLATLASCAVLFGVLVVQGRLGALRHWGWRGYLYSAALGAVNPVLYYLVLFEAYARLPAQEAQPLNYAWPVVLVAFSAVALRQRVRRGEIAALLVCLAGVAVISTRGDLAGLRFTDTAGVLLALGSTVLWASYWLLNARDGRDPVARLFMNFLFGAALVTAYVVVRGDVRMPPAPGLAGAVYVGLFEMGLTFVLWLHALRLSHSTAAVSGLVYLAPFLSLVLIHLVVGEPIYPSTPVGLALIVGGIVAQQRLGGAARR